MVTVMRYLFSLENVEEKRSHYIIAALTLIFQVESLQALENHTLHTLGGKGSGEGRDIKG